MSEGEEGGGAKSGALFLPGAEVNTKKSGKNCIHLRTRSPRRGGGVSLAARRDWRRFQNVSKKRPTQK